MDTLAEALEWAADYCERTMFKVPLKSNGYVVDGYKPPTYEEKASIIMQVAQSAYDNEHHNYTLMHTRLSQLSALWGACMPNSELAAQKIVRLMEDWGYAI